MRRNSYITEHVVANVDAVTKYAEHWASQVSAPEAKAWFAKRLRAFILNNEHLLRRLDPQEVTTAMPAYVHMAADKNEPIFVFDGNLEGVFVGNTNIPFSERIAHIKDFFDNLHEVSTRRVNAENAVEMENQRVARKLLSKLQKMPLEAVEQAHEQWSKRGAKQVANLSKEGCEVVMTFGDGRYWVRYTDLDTMKRDGADLQNCLRTGTYWSQVANGTQSVYGLRKPNDEAVVGLRVYNEEQPRLAECKGKQNEAALPGDVPYIIALLEKLGVTNLTADLQGAGIHVNDGRYGTFEDIADVIMDENGIKILKTSNGHEDRCLIKVRRHQFWATVTDGQISHFKGIESVPAQRIIEALNAFGHPVSGTSLTLLASLAIFPSEKGFGTIEDVGVTVWTGKGNDRAISLLRNGSGYLFVYVGADGARFEVKSNTIHAFPRGAEDLVYNDVDSVVEAFNAAGVKATTQIEKENLWWAGYFHTKSGYKDIHDASRKIAEFDGIEFLAFTDQLSDRQLKVYQLVNPRQQTAGNVTFTIWRGDLLAYNTGEDEMKSAIIRAVQWLVSEHVVRNHRFDTRFDAGIFYDSASAEFFSDVKTFLEKIEEPEAKYDYLCDLGQQGTVADRLRTAFQTHRDADGVLKPAIQDRIYRALKPKKEELWLVRSEREMVIGGKKYHGMTLTPADTILTLAEVLPRHRDKIANIRVALQKALQLLIRKGRGRVSYYIDSYDSQFRWNINKANDEFRNNVANDAQLDKEAEPEEAEDTFAALNAIRKANARRY